MTQTVLQFVPPPRVVAPWATPSRPLDRSQWFGECEGATKLARHRRAAEIERAGERVLGWDGTDGLEGDDARISRFVEVLRYGSDEPANVQAVTPIAEDYWDSPPSTLPLPVPKWHFDRANAHRDRWERLGECGRRQVTVSCECGGTKPRSTVLRCDHWTMCQSCKGARKNRYQARFTKGRSALLRRMHAFTNRRTRRAEGRWSEKMITLTVPHSGNAAEDIRALNAAFPRFRARLARYIWRRSHKTVKWSTVPYWRSMEITESADGHAHFHVWMMLPFVPQALLAHWWALSLPDEYRARVPRVPLYVTPSDPRDRAELARAARGSGVLLRPVVDVRAADERARGEIVKYLVKDCIGDPRDGHYIEPRVYATIYAALMGARAVATSVRFVPEYEPQKCWCESCGAMLDKRFEMVPEVPALGQAPPS